ncbi:hypothetical protein AEQ18_15100 [Enterococcus sp. RIT-PI-f]|nr:hypothetical protein AEQ18_15100 [Enterococcus sp. RIT-PI-f]
MSFLAPIFRLVLFSVKWKAIDENLQEIIGFLYILSFFFKKQLDLSNTKLYSSKKLEQEYVK